MVKITHDIMISKKIAALAKKAPSDWAEQIAVLMGRKSVQSIYYYAAGQRGVKKGYPLEVLKHLNRIVQEKDKRTEKELKKIKA